MKLPAAGSGVSVYRRIHQAFTASGGEFNPERLKLLMITLMIIQKMLL